MKKLTASLKILIFSFLEVGDIFKILLLSKCINKLCEKKLFQEICLNSKFGEKVMENTKGKEHENIRWKKRVEIYFIYNNSPGQRRKRGFIGKIITREIHPSQIHNVPMLFSKSLFDTNWCNFLFENTFIASNFKTQSNDDLYGSISENQKIVIELNDQIREEQSLTLKEVNRQENLCWLLRALLKVGLTKGRIWISSFYTKVAEEIRCISIWKNPYSKAPLDYLHKQKYGLNSKPSTLSVGQWIKVRNKLERFEKIHREVIDISKIPHWTLLLLGVITHRRNQSIGPRCIIPILKSADQSNLKIYLGLFEPSESLYTFFEHRGFKLNSKIPFYPKKKKSPMVWNLIRKPQ